MKVIHSTMSTDHYWKELVYTYVRLDANPKTVHLAPGVRTFIEKFEDISRTERETEWAVVQDQAQSHASDELIEGELRTLQSSVLNLVKQNRKDPLYKEMFPMDLSRLLRLKPSERIEDIARMKKVLERGDYSDDFRLDQEILLDNVLEEVDKILERKAKLEDRQFKHQALVQDWKNEVNTLRREVYGDLLKFPESADAAWVKGFFRVVRKSTKTTALAKSKKEVARAQKKLEELTALHAKATTEISKAEFRAAIEVAKAELEAKYQEFIKNGGKEVVKKVEGPQTPPQLPQLPSGDSGESGEAEL